MNFGKINICEMDKEGLERLLQSLKYVKNRQELILGACEIMIKQIEDELKMKLINN